MIEGNQIVHRGDEIKEKEGLERREERSKIISVYLDGGLLSWKQHGNLVRKLHKELDWVLNWRIQARKWKWRDQKEHKGLWDTDRTPAIRMVFIPRRNYFSVVIAPLSPLSSLHLTPSRSTPISSSHLDDWEKKRQKTSGRHTNRSTIISLPQSPLSHL